VIRLSSFQYCSDAAVVWPTYTKSQHGGACWPIQDILSLVLCEQESIIPSLLPPICVTLATAILLRDFCAMYELPPTLPLYAIHHTILIMTISCKGQGTCSASRCPVRLGKKINRSHTHTPTENNTPDTDTHDSTLEFPILKTTKL